MSDSEHESSRRHLGLLGATGVGVGAIVGGGILALAGVAFATAGPAAMVAFAINGVIALLTALSFAEMASKFPQSGGTYTFSRKVLSVEAAFTVGWVVWFASIVASVLYALGFSFFAVRFALDLANVSSVPLPDWVDSQRFLSILAGVATLGISWMMCRSTGGSGPWANILKVVVFGTVVLGGLWAIATTAPPVDVEPAARTFFVNGGQGLITAMGYTFIALQGFDLIAAVGGEIRDPERNVPRAMIASLLIALAIYLPLLWVITEVGIGPDETIADVAAANPESLVSTAVGRFLGRPGYYLVNVAAVLAMLTALQANLFAASRIAAAMSRDRTLPSWLANSNRPGRPPVGAIAVTGGLVVALVALLPDVSAAGAASSLIFLVTFAIAHWLCVLVRQRSGDSPPPFRSPLFPMVPVLGGLACLGLAIFQGVTVPAAGSIAMTWLSIGGLLFLTLFARRARTMDAASVGANPELARLRGTAPLVLVPIANPGNADALISTAARLVPRGVGRVLAHTVVVASPDWNPLEDEGPSQRSANTMRQIQIASRRHGVACEALSTIAPSPMKEIARVAKLHRCESVLLGLSSITDDAADQPLEALLGALDTDVVVQRTGPGYELSQVRRILVPFGGRGGHDYLLARLIASLTRNTHREVHFLRVMPRLSSESELRRAKRLLRTMAVGNFGATGRCEIAINDDAVAEIASHQNDETLTILGVQRLGPRKKLFGSFTRQIARQSNAPLIIISRRG